jgi:diaminopropionate ammonia-lyase
MTDRFLANPNQGGMADPLQWSRQPLSFHRRMSGYAPTALVDARDIADTLGLGRVVVKNESSRLGLPSFKVLGAAWASYRALVRRLGREPEWATFDDLAAALDVLRPLTLAAATDGNHGRAVAHVARLLGFDAHIFVPAGTVDARIQAIADEGARVTVVAGDYDAAVARSAEEAGKRCLVISDTSWPGYTTVPREVIEGYSTIFIEVDDALDAAGSDGPTALFVPVGVGAFAAAAVSHYRQPQRASQPVLASVEPTDADCLRASIAAGRIEPVPGPHHSVMVGLNCGTPSLIAWPTLSAGIDYCVAVDDSRAEEAMRMLAGAGIVSGESGAASLAGLIAVLDSPEAADRRVALGLDADATVLLMCTEGATDPGNYEAIVGIRPDEIDAGISIPVAKGFDSGSDAQAGQ